MCLFLRSKQDVQVLVVFLELHEPRLINYNVHCENTSNWIRWMCRIAHRIKLHISNLLFWVHDNLYESEKFCDGVRANDHRNLAHGHPVDLNGKKIRSHNTRAQGHCSDVATPRHTLKLDIHSSHSLDSRGRKTCKHTPEKKKNTHEEVAAGCELSSRIKGKKKSLRSKNTWSPVSCLIWRHKETQRNENTNDHYKPDS